MKKICKVCLYINDGENDELKGDCLCGNMDWEDYDLYQMKQISSEQSFIDAMLKLRENDPIEYQLKMQQIKLQLQQQRQIKLAEQESNIPHCPTCNSTNINKINGLSKAVSVAMWGLFSRKVHKQWHCNNCGSEW